MMNERPKTSNGVYRGGAIGAASANNFEKA